MRQPDKLGQSERALNVIEAVVVAQHRHVIGKGAAFGADLVIGIYAVIAELAHPGGKRLVRSVQCNGEGNGPRGVRVWSSVCAMHGLLESKHALAHEPLLHQAVASPCVH